MGKTAEFNRIIEEHAQGIYTHAHAMLGSREEAEEAVQDVFLRIYRSIGGFRGEAKISTWIWRITTNVCLSRRESRRQVVTTSLDAAGSSEIRDHNPDPEISFIVSEERGRLGRMIASLPDREAAVLTLYYLEGKEYKEIAGILDISEGSVASAIHRGRERLAGRLLKSKEAS
ncbi:MAG TPA: RNA polymerase sigma factor [Bacteroidota bacterium]|nr:RNA polymerase sigma factor [Bacteroidota bacterium]